MAFVVYDGNIYGGAHSCSTFDGGSSGSEAGGMVVNRGSGPGCRGGRDIRGSALEWW